MSTSSAEVARSTGIRPAPVTETIFRPAVDIFEDADGITLHADMPGVSKERLNVHVDGTKLLLEGEVQPANGAQAAAGATRYRRSFALSRELETDRIEAKVKNGVLTVRIPKRAENRPRKIEIQ
jgi:HSP20 family molecular chaperone IbpA